jgi:hypothetical protein
MTSLNLTQSPYSNTTGIALSTMPPDGRRSSFSGFDNQSAFPSSVTPSGVGDVVSESIPVSTSGVTALPVYTISLPQPSFDSVPPQAESPSQAPMQSGICLVCTSGGCQRIACGGSRRSMLPLSDAEDLKGLTRKPSANIPKDAESHNPGGEGIRDREQEGQKSGIFKEMSPVLVSQSHTLTTTR